MAQPPIFANIVELSTLSVFASLSSRFAVVSVPFKVIVPKTNQLTFHSFTGDLYVKHSTLKFCHRTGIARSEGRGDAQGNKSCLARSSILVNPSIQTVGTKFIQKTYVDFLMESITPLRVTMSQRPEMVQFSGGEFENDTLC